MTRKEKSIKVGAYGDVPARVISEYQVASVVADIICKESGFPRDDICLQHVLSKDLRIDKHARLALRAKLADTLYVAEPYSSSTVTVRSYIRDILENLGCLNPSVEHYDLSPLSKPAPEPEIIPEPEPEPEPEFEFSGPETLTLNMVDVSKKLTVKEIEDLTSLIKKISS